MLWGRIPLTLSAFLFLLNFWLFTKSVSLNFRLWPLKAVTFNDSFWLWPFFWLAFLCTLGFIELLRITSACLLCLRPLIEWCIFRFRPKLCRNFWLFRHWLLFSFFLNLREFLRLFYLWCLRRRVKVLVINNKIIGLRAIAR